MSSTITRSAWLKLYKELQSEAKKLPQYNYRVFAHRRIRDHFEKNRGVVDTGVLNTLFEKGKQSLSTIRRQAIIGHLYPHQQTIVESKVSPQH
ncbi:unnamed protein product [Auanema sp. JU1783]|nr:unnamed protein product [Auanema sp. JU1783]